MGRLILLLLFCFTVNAQSITVSGTVYQLAGDEIMSDPNTYLHQFVEDALARGHDFTGVRGTFRYYDGGGAGFSVRAVGCRGSFEIGLQNYYWNTQGYEGRRVLIYHELGHALLQLAHVCYEFNGTFPPLYEVYEDHPDFESYSGDIMWSLRECNRTVIGTDPHPTDPTRTIIRYKWYQRIPLNWDEQLDRMFNPGYQRFHSCGSGKSSNPIIDY